MRIHRQMLCQTCTAALLIARVAWNSVSALEVVRWARPGA